MSSSNQIDMRKTIAYKFEISFHDKPTIKRALYIFGLSWIILISLGIIYAILYLFLLNYPILLGIYISVLLIGMIINLIISISFIRYWNKSYANAKKHSKIKCNKCSFLNTFLDYSIIEKELITKKCQECNADLENVLEKYIYLQRLKRIK